ncbi:type IV secretion system protein [Faecalibaculum rodentium]|uniref:type IV secretion system protein n=1 Tax=Faecalibaculum rodentium TaxID=1702221 RepID=UPI0023F29C27|nr:type IV secretion system protein [Faecalibaculum rodentium]
MSILSDIQDSAAGYIGEVVSNFDMGLTNLVEIAQTDPSAPVTGFPTAELWETSVSISNSIGNGIAASLVGLFLMFELASVFNRSDTKGWDGIYWILMAFLKVAVMAAICNNMSLIITIVFSISSSVINDVGGAGSIEEATKNLETIAKSLVDYYKDQSFFTVIMGAIMAFIVDFARMISFMLADVACKMRLIEIYVFTAMAPIAISTMASKEYQNIGISFIKRLLALGLQGAFIVLVCAMYVTIVQATLNSLVSESGQVSGLNIGMLIPLVGYAVLLVITIFRTGGWAKSLLQVN